MDIIDLNCFEQKGEREKGSLEKAGFFFFFFFFRIHKGGLSDPPPCFPLLPPSPNPKIAVNAATTSGERER